MARMLGNTSHSKGDNVHDARMAGGRAGRAFAHAIERNRRAAGDVDPPWEVATDDDFEIAVHGALQRAGCTFHELVAMAMCGEFESVRAKMAWVAIGDLTHVRETRTHDRT